MGKDTHRYEDNEPMNDRRNTTDSARRLVEALVEEPGTQACEACLDGLEAYVDAQLAGRDYAALQPVVARHLDQCVTCAEAYALIYEARLAEAAPLQLEHIPDPDVGFLEPGAVGRIIPNQLRAHRTKSVFLHHEAYEDHEGDKLTQSVADAARAAPDLSDIVRRAIAYIDATLRVTFSRELLDRLAIPPQTPMPAYREQPQQKPLYDIVIDHPTPDVEQLQMTVYPDLQSTDRCTLRVRVALPGRDWPDLAGVAVLARLSGVKHHATTDPWGEAIISDLPLADLPELHVEVIAAPPTST
jgi:hypothetical protein